MGASGKLWLGEEIDEAGTRAGAPVELDPAHLTTHGVILGMTGSGKTGLGVVLLEEALLRGIPALVLDPKGDMGNLLLNFPLLRAEDFAPWVGERPAPGGAEAGAAPGDAGARAAESWRAGLESWGLGAERMRELGTRADFALYTPGSSAGVPLNVLGSLDPPPGTAVEARADEVESLASGVLALVGRAGDPLSDPAHILLSNLIDRAWREGSPLDLPTLVAQTADPPIRKLGVFDLDTFMPPADRMRLAVELNALLASPAFGTWLRGAPLNMDALLRSPDGRPRAAILYLAHLSEAERQFVVTLALSKLVTWMRRQPGTESLRALVYMDEVYGFAPPTAAPPSKKPILTILKQARAHGVGMVLSTQNPVDLDYKAMANAGTWLIGRLQTERDKARVLEGMRSAAGDTDLGELGQRIGGLGKRQFLLHSSRGGAPRRFTTRWALSFLRGPLTRVEVERLMVDHPARTAALATRGEGRGADDEAAGQTREGTPPGAAEAGALRGQGGGGAAALAEDESPVPPRTPDRVPVRWLDPAAPWTLELGAHPGGRRLEAALAARVRLRFDEAAADLEHDETYECVWFPLPEHPKPDQATVVDYDERDLRKAPPENAVYVLPRADVDSAALYRDAGRDLAEHLYRNRSLEVLHNAELKLFSRVGEDREAFLARCRAAADARADEEVAKSRARYEDRLRKLEQRMRDAERRVEELTVDTRQRTQQELVAGAGELLSLFLGGRRSVRGLSGIASRRSTTRRTRQRLASATEKAQDVQEAMDELEQELAEELRDTADRWDAVAERIEPRSISLEKNDIAVEEVVLVWVPTD